MAPSLWLAPDEDFKGRYPELLEWIRQRYRNGSAIYSACSGSVMLAATGLLDNKQATSHWGYADLFRRHYPQVRFRPEPALVFADPAGHIVTAGGSTSWHDLAIHIIARHLNPGEAMRIAKVYLLKWHSEGQLPYAALVHQQSHADSVVRQCEDWLGANYRVAEAVMRVVAVSGIPKRTLKRRFKAATSATLIGYVQNLRVEEAKRQLETNAVHFEAIAADLGYENLAFFRRLFKRATGLTPGQYRKMFRPFMASNPLPRAARLLNARQNSDTFKPQYWCYHRVHGRRAEEPLARGFLIPPAFRALDGNCRQWRSAMSERDYGSSGMEAVGIFHDIRSFEAAIDSLLSAGFDHVDLNVLAHEDAVKEKLGRSYKSTKELMDDPDAPRIGYVPEETIGDAEGAVIGAGVYVPAIVGSLAVVASGGTLLGAVAAAVIAGGAGGLVGAALARVIGVEHARHLDQHLQNGGLLLWVRTRDPEHADMALEILRRHSADDVHLHAIPERVGKPGDVPSERPRIVHILERPPESGAPTTAA